MYFQLEVEKELCTGCGNCVVICPINAFRLSEVSGGKGGGIELRIEDGVSQVTMESCNGCGTCIRVCPQKAISLSVIEQTPASRELRVHGIEVEEGVEVEVAKRPEGMPISFKIDPKFKAILESASNSLKSIKIRYLIERGKIEDAREMITRKQEESA